MQKLLALFLLVALGARAQVNVEIVLDEDQFLRGEAMPVRVKISNFSGQALRLAETSDWLSFLVTGDDAKAVRQIRPLPEMKPFSVESAQTISVRVNLEPHFDWGASGRFSVSAQLKCPQLQKEFPTATEKFGLITGAKVWQEEVGVPGQTPPVVRRYALQQASFFKETRLYARVAEANDTDLVGVVLLGALPAAGRPVAAVDRSSQLHVIFQSGQRQFSYHVISPEGEHLIRQTYEITATRPRLRAEPDGRVVVQGGERKITAKDLPPPAPVPQTNTVVQAK